MSQEDPDTDSVSAELRRIFKSRAPEREFRELLLRTDKHERKEILKKAVDEVGSSDGQQCSQNTNNDDLSNAAEQIVRCVLHLAVHNHDISSDDLDDITKQLLSNLDQLPTKGLAGALTYCMEYLRTPEKDDMPSQWVEIFTKIMEALNSRQSIPYDDDWLQPKELRTTVINQLCRIEWSSKNAAYIVSAIRKFPGLELTDQETVIEKTAESIKKMDQLAVPSVAYHLLLLGKDQLAEKVLEVFNDYFQAVNFTTPDVSTQYQTNTQVISNKLRKALGTVVFHVVNTAGLEASLAKCIVKRIKNSCMDDRLIMTPFLLSTALGLTSIAQFKQQVVDGLTLSISDSFKDEQNSRKYAWFGSIRGTVNKTYSSCFKDIIDARSSELDFMLDGLKHLAFSLLNVDKPKLSVNIGSCQELGSYILVALIKKSPSSFKSVIDELLANSKSAAHMCCLALCLKSMVKEIVQTKLSDRIVELIHKLPLMTVESATPVVKSLMTPFQLSRNLLKQLLGMLRKTVYKSVEARRVTAQIMILLLSNSKIVGAIPRSQYSESQGGFMTQMSQTQVDLLGSARENEGLCVEVLLVLKTFFSQPSEVRQLLYLGLHDVSRKNPELIKVICAHLLSHMEKYVDETSGDFRYHGLLDLSGSNVKRAEQLGHLVQCVSFVVLRGRRVYKKCADDEPESLLRCEDMLQKWIDMVLKVQVEELDVAASSVLSAPDAGAAMRSDCTDEAKNELIRLLMETVEALMEYVALRENNAETGSVDDLHFKLCTLQHNLKKIKLTKDKDKKDDKNKKGRGDKKKPGKVSNQNSNPSNSLKDSDLSIKKSPGKDDKVSENPCNHIITSESALEVLQKFNSSHSPVEMGIARCKPEFERLILSVIRNKVKKLQNGESIGERERKPQDVVNTFSQILGELWSRCCTEHSQEQSQNSNAVDEIQIIEELNLKVPLSILRLEVVLELMEFICSQNILPKNVVLQNLNLEVFDDKEVEDLFGDFMQVWKDLVHQLANGPKAAKSLQIVFEVLNVMSSVLTPGHATVLADVLDWTMEYVKTSKENCLPTPELAESAVKCILSYGLKLGKRAEAEFFKVAAAAHECLGTIEDDGEASSASSSRQQRYWLINDETSPTVVCTIGCQLEESLQLLDNMGKRLKIQSQYYEKGRIGDIRDKICGVLIDTVNLSSELIKSSVPAGPTTDILIRLIIQIFANATRLAEQLCEYHSKNKATFTARKYSGLVKLIGKEFKYRIELLINHVESINREKANELLQNKKDGRIPAALRQKFMKDSRTIPELIFQIEKFDLQVYALSQKININLLAGTKLSTARDFRIDAVPLRQALAKQTKEKPKKRSAASMAVDEDTNTNDSVTSDNSVATEVAGSDSTSIGLSCLSDVSASQQNQSSSSTKRLRR